MIAPAKLAALVKREQASPFASPELYEAPEDMDMMDEEMPAEEEDGNPGLSEEDIAAISEMIDAGDGDAILMALAEELEDMAEEEGVENLNPSWVKDEGAWKEAVAAVDPEGEGKAKYSEPWAVVAHTYRKMI